MEGTGALGSRGQGTGADESWVVENLCETVTVSSVETVGITMEESRAFYIRLYVLFHLPFPP